MTTFYEFLPLMADTEEGKSQAGKTLLPRDKPSLRLSARATTDHANRYEREIVGSKTLQRLVG